MTAQAAIQDRDSGLWADDAQIAEALLGRGLPEKAEWHLRQAGQAYQNDQLAESHLQQARKIAPDHVAVLIGLYRYYFYKGRLRHALSIAIQCLDRALLELNLADDWRQVLPSDAEFNDYGAILPRFFLFTLKGYAYLNMRLGDMAEGRSAVAKLQELDPGDKLGGSVLQGVLDRIGLDDDE